MNTSFALKVPMVHQINIRCKQVARKPFINRKEYHMGAAMKWTVEWDYVTLYVLLVKGSGRYI